MKTSHRFLLGVLSSLLFSVGLSRAASVFDPMGRMGPNEGTTSVMTGAPDSSNYCDVLDPNE